jgi:hypothetical protein
MAVAGESSLLEQVATAPFWTNHWDKHCVSSPSFLQAGAKAVWRTPVDACSDRTAF